MACLLAAVFLFVGSSAFSSLPNAIIGRVNDVPVLESDLDLLPKGLDQDEKMDRLVLFHLAVQEAKKLGLDQSVEAQRTINKVLYEAYLKVMSKKAQMRLEPTEEDLKRYYETAPLLRVRHLVLFAQTPSEKENAEKKLKQIDTALNGKAQFRDLIFKYSQDESARTGGDLDFRGKHSLSKLFYTGLLELEQNAVSKPIFLDGAFHLFQWTEKKPFPEIPATYREYLRSELRKETTDRLLKDALSTLRKTARIEMPLVKGKND